MYKNLQKKIITMFLLFSFAFPYAINGATRINSFCAVTGCTTRTVYNSKYCSEHVCKMGGCLDRGDHQGYCYKHRYKSTKKNKEPGSDSDTNKCMVNGCNMYRGRGYDYCTLHSCSKIGCHNQRISGSTYCREHANP